MTRALGALALLCATFSGDVANATVIQFSDRASWESTVGIFVVEDFETTPLGEITCSQAGVFNCPTEIIIDAPNLDIVIPPGADIGTGPTGIVASGDVDGSREYRADLHSGVLVAGIASNTFVLSGPATSFAVDLANVVDFDEHCYVDCGLVPFPLTIELAGESFPLAFDSQFFGVTSTTPFDQVVVRSTSWEQGTAVLASFDNVSFVVVPEPSTAMLLLAGVALMSRRGIRAKARAA